MKEKLPLALLLAAPYALLAGGIALLSHGKPWMALALWGLIVLLVFAPGMIRAFLRAGDGRRGGCCFGTCC